MEFWNRLQELDIIAVSVAYRFVFETDHIPIGVGGVKHRDVGSLGNDLDDHVVHAGTGADIQRQTAGVDICLADGMLLVVVKRVYDGFLPGGLCGGGQSEIAGGS